MTVFTYQVQLHDGTVRHYEVDTNRSYNVAEHNAREYPEWTRLENQQCHNCPLDAEEHRYCPAALEFEEIASHFANAVSIERVDVWVNTESRGYFKNTDIQTMLKSLYGLIMASGACPILSRMKSLAHHHLPFATLEETVHRLIGNYLITQYLHQHDGTAEPDWELKGVEQLYSELKVVNLALMKRIRQASKEDASVNAMQTFVSISSIVEMGVEDVINKMMPMLRKAL